MQLWQARVGQTGLRGPQYITGGIYTPRCLDRRPRRFCLISIGRRRPRFAKLARTAWVPPQVGVSHQVVGSRPGACEISQVGVSHQVVGSRPGACEISHVGVPPRSRVRARQRAKFDNLIKFI